VTVRFLGTFFKMLPGELKVVPFTVGDHVMWTSCDDDVPKDIGGRVRGWVEETGRVQVQFCTRLFSMLPDELKLVAFGQCSTIHSRRRPADGTPPADVSRPTQRRRVDPAGAITIGMPDGVDREVWSQIPASAKVFALGGNVNDTSVRNRRGTSSSAQASLDAKPECIICMLAPADATFVHGETGHTVCCLSCAKRVKLQQGTCPTCRMPIESVIRCFGM